MAIINEHAICGFYGKVPARADFVRARLAPTTVERWDGWLQEAIAASQRTIGDRWQELFYRAPLWRFILPVGACGSHGLVGVLMPSVDSVGRCFPFMMAREVADLWDAVGVLANAGRWFAALEQMALTVLADDFELGDLDRPLPPLEINPSRGARSWAAVADEPVGIWIDLVHTASAHAVLLNLLASRPSNGGVGPALWWTAGGDARSPGIGMTAGLIPVRGFAALLDGCWEAHGWRLASRGRDDAGYGSIETSSDDDPYPWDRIR
jgi:type VI secretion system protein ImpM